MEGVKSLGVGIGLGIQGLFTSPYNGAKKEGLSGGVKGMARGIFGLVAHPVGGTITLVTKTAQGLKETPMTIFKGMENRQLKKRRKLELKMKNYLK